MTIRIDQQGKRIISLILSIVLTLLCVLCLQNSKVVEAVDEAVLLEKKHPGYWTWLGSKTIGAGNNTVIYPVSKLYIEDISYDDWLLLKNTINERRIVDFGDGTGIDVLQSTYGELDRDSWVISDKIDTIVDHGDYLSLSKSDGKTTMA